MGSVEGNREGTVGGGELEEIAWGEILDIGEGEAGSKSHFHVCTYATILRFLHTYPQT